MRHPVDIPAKQQDPLTGGYGQEQRTQQEAGAGGTWLALTKSSTEKGGQLTGLVSSRPKSDLMWADWSIVKKGRLDNRLDWARGRGRGWEGSDPNPKLIFNFVLLEFGHWRATKIN